MNFCEYWGICVNLLDGYYCDCILEWIGMNCIEVNYCYLNLC